MPWERMPSGGFDADEGAIDGETSVSIESDGFGIGGAFLLKDACRDIVRGVGVEDGDGALEDNGAVVVLVVGEVDGAAADFDAASNDGIVNVMTVEALAAEGGDESGVDVHHPVEEVVRDPDETEKAGKCHEIGVGFSAK